MSCSRRGVDAVCGLGGTIKTTDTAAYLHTHAICFYFTGIARIALLRRWERSVLGGLANIHVEGRSER